MILRTFERSELPTQVAKSFQEVVRKTISATGGCRIVLTGGGLGIEFLKALRESDVDWKAVSVVFSDERFVPMNHPDRNEHQALEALPALEQAHWLRFPGDREDLVSAASAFSKELVQNFGDPSDGVVFDLVILGMGPDGHVASLFPERRHSEDLVVAEDSSPKPPTSRLSLSYNLLNSANRVWFLVAGKEKADAMRNALKGDALPAGRVRGSSETIWWIDQEISDAL